MIRQDEQLHENKNTNPPPQLPPLNLQPHSFSSLPDVIVENILARISKCNYPNLSLVSKRFLSLLFSPEIYTTRSRIGTTEPCIYICVERFKDLGLKWYTLWTKHAHVETLTVDNAQEDDLPNNEYSLVPLPESNSLPSSSVRILDCRSHTWRDGPSMLVARRCPYAVFLDEKIYVFDGCGEDDTWMEVLDMKTNTWSPLLRHKDAVLEEGWLNTVGLQGKIYLITKINYCAYDPKQGTWEVVEVHDNLGYLGKLCVSVIDDVMYSYSYYSDNLVWYDSKCKKWIDVKLSNFELLYEWRMVNILNHGGKLLVMWLCNFEEYDEIEGWKLRCAKIMLEKRHGNEVWGEIEWPVTEVKLPELSERFNSLVISI
ncbi:hypothetical protein BRARA_A00714 [Brassica rapa]|uniref:BnaA01g06720D protein n=3 Tax=Brassica TaxID=3705 RepID=A0A078GSQ6_BRANA|nr:hypothetical protein HID58_000673 [Brassica napus]RID77835.1 hypothetical protein BRARA_A00714 [Brassica rapa]CAF2147807.1 unnamed protein product [Brassica napus]CDY28177.1 BnaA01g06720D [Brassica napus]